VFSTRRPEVDRRKARLRKTIKTMLSTRTVPSAIVIVQIILFLNCFPFVFVVKKAACPTTAPDEATVGDPRCCCCCRSCDTKDDVAGLSLSSMAKECKDVRWAAIQVVHLHEERC